MTAGGPSTGSHAGHLKRALAMLQEPDIAAAMAEDQHPKIIEDYDIPDLGGSSVAAQQSGAPVEVYIDAAIAKKKPKIAGLEYKQAREGICRHEWFENVLVRLRQMQYLEAHDMAEALENYFVETELHAAPALYEEQWGPMVKLTENEDIKNPPHDLACYPYWMNPNARDIRILKKLADLGVPDAFHPAAVKHGAKKARDGEWYSPDPARPGKHLRLDVGG